MATDDHNTKGGGVEVTDSTSLKFTAPVKKSRSGVILVPQPSNDERDPLVGIPTIGYESV